MANSSTFFLLVLMAVFATAFPVPGAVKWNMLSKRACSAQQKSRVEAGQRGIAKNIGVQHKELKTLSKVAKSDPGYSGGGKSGGGKGGGKGGKVKRDEAESFLEARSVEAGETVVQVIESRDLGSEVDESAHLEARGLAVRDPAGGKSGGGGSSGGKSGGSSSSFKSSKSELQGNIKSGQNIREKNQKTLPSNNGAQGGLKKVAGAQAKESKQASSLNGGKGDKHTINTLRTEFKGGIKQNEKNYKAAGKQCAKRDLERIEWVQANMPEFASM